MSNTAVFSCAAWWAGSPGGGGRTRLAEAPGRRTAVTSVLLLPGGVPAACGCALRFRGGDQKRRERELCVLLLEDKMRAAGAQPPGEGPPWGRVSAGIAHEIRNPLAAIAQA